MRNLNTVFFEAMAACAGKRNVAHSRLIVFLFIVILTPNVIATQFKDIPYDELTTLSRQLQGPFASVQTAEEIWRSSNLRTSVCSPLVIRVTSVDGLEAAPSTVPGVYQPLPRFTEPLPQVVISGEIHGNERVGPIASLFTSQLLVWAAMCAIQHSDSHCGHLRKLKIRGDEITWLAFLATSRDTFVLPAPNCDGYVQNTRNEQGIDTNRDFSYSRNDDNCFQTVTARTFQALFSTALVQILVTFHGGMVALGYEWGSMDHPRGKDLSPDHMAHRDVGDSMASFAGTFPKEKSYKAKPINSIVYPVFGGMEDWAYAAGWDSARVRTNCVGLNSYIAGDSSRLKNSIPNNRAVTFLVETSDLKRPHASQFGHDTSILANDASNNNDFGGHIPRNTRLALAAIDFVEPYICFHPRTGKLFNTNDTQGLYVQWYVGGARTVDKTWLSWHSTPPQKKRELDSISTTMASPIQSGLGKWGLSNPMNVASDEGQFVAHVIPPHEILRANNQKKLWLVAHAVVDQNWAKKGQGYPQHLGPQSHLVQLRTNSTYQASFHPTLDPQNVRLKGRKEWISDPIEVSFSHEGRNLRTRRRPKRKAHTRWHLRGKGNQDNIAMKVLSLVENCAWWKLT